VGGIDRATAYPIAWVAGFDPDHPPPGLTAVSPFKCAANYDDDWCDGWKK